MSTVLRALGVAVLLTGLGVGIGVWRHAPASAPPAPVRYGAPLASVDTTVLHVARAAFCDHVPRADVDAVLGGRPRSVTSYSPGRRAQVTSGVTDVADEYSCTWRGASTTARAWVFAPPVTRAWARGLAGVPHDCRPVHGMRFGRPSTAYRCGGTTTVAGLFGDAWLTCSLTSRDVGLVGRWCVAIARSAA